MSTLDILAHYMAIPHHDIVAIIQNIDTPANGIAMQIDHHDAFDSFEICLVPTEVRDTFVSFLQKYY
jgi:hypothetical protein